LDPVIPFSGRSGHLPCANLRNSDPGNGLTWYRRSIPARRRSVMPERQQGFHVRP